MPKTRFISRLVSALTTVALLLQIAVPTAFGLDRFGYIDWGLTQTTPPSAMVICDMGMDMAAMASHHASMETMGSMSSAMPVMMAGKQPPCCPPKIASKSISKPDNCNCQLGNSDTSDESSAEPASLSNAGFAAMAALVVYATATVDFETPDIGFHRLDHSLSEHPGPPPVYLLNSSFLN